MSGLIGKAKVRELCSASLGLQCYRIRNADEIAMANGHEYKLEARPASAKYREYMALEYSALHVQLKLNIYSRPRPTWLTSNYILRITALV